MGDMCGSAHSHLVKGETISRAYRWARGLFAFSTISITRRGRRLFLASGGPTLLRAAALSHQNRADRNPLGKACRDQSEIRCRCGAFTRRGSVIAANHQIRRRDGDFGLHLSTNASAAAVVGIREIHLKIMICTCRHALIEQRRNASWRGISSFTTNKEGMRHSSAIRLWQASRFPASTRSQPLTATSLEYSFEPPKKSTGQFFDPEGRVLLNRADLPPTGFGPSQSWKFERTFTSCSLTSRCPDLWMG
jgi:hypothetical protein